MTTYNQELILKAISSIKSAETMAYNQLKPLSRELLSYVVDTGDIAMVNRLLEALRPVMRKEATAYFTHFLPYNYDKATANFSTKIKNKDKREAKLKDMTAFLDISDNSLYSWKAEKKAAAKKPVDYLAKIKKDTEKAVKADLSADVIINALLEGGLDLDDLAVFLAKQPDATSEAA